MAKKNNQVSKFNLKSDIKVFCVTAKSFPDGVMAAHKKLHSLVSFSKDRKYFGISRPENGKITYFAAAEEKISGETEKYKCKSFIIKKGNYLCIEINDYIKNISEIGDTFQTLISNPNIEESGYCIEWYLDDKKMNCMVKLK